MGACTLTPCLRLAMLAYTPDLYVPDKLATCKTEWGPLDYRYLLKVSWSNLQAEVLCRMNVRKLGFESTRA